MMEPGAAPALTPRKRDPGRPRVAVRLHYGRPPSVAGRERRKAAKAACKGAETPDPHGKGRKLLIRCRKNGPEDRNRRK